MATLHEMTQDFLNLLELLEDGADPEIVEATLEGLDYEIEQKADGYAKVLQELDAREAAFDKEIDRMTGIRDGIKANKKRLKESLQNSMELTGKTKFKTDLFSFWIQNNTPALKIDQEDKIPQQFLIPQPPKQDTAAIKKFLKDNKVDWAHLEQGRSVRIK